MPGDYISSMFTILVIDDEADIRNVVSTLLTQAGYQTIDAEYGLSGYGRAQAEQPDLILLDLMMPVMDGFEVLRKLKSDSSTQTIPVIILTARIDAASERECMRLGATDYIKKPWGPKELEDRIGMALGYPELGSPPSSTLDQFTPDELKPNGPSADDAIPQDAIPPGAMLQAQDVPADADESVELAETGDVSEDETEAPERADQSLPSRFKTRSFRAGVDPAGLV